MHRFKKLATGHCSITSLAASVSVLSRGTRPNAGELVQVWERLVWRGKHAQAPVAVAAKPHYFGELDVVASVAALARADGGAFWRSPEVREAAALGGMLELDPDFFAQACDPFDGRVQGSGSGALALAGGSRGEMRAAARLSWPRILCARMCPLSGDVSSAVSHDDAETVHSGADRASHVILEA